MAETLDLVIRAQNQANAALNGLRGTLDQLNKDTQRAGAALSLGVSAPFALFAKTGLDTMGQFSQSMAQIEVLSGANEEQFQRLTDTAIRLGAETSFSANEAAGGMLELLKAGLDTEQTLAAIPGVMSLAAAGGVDLATSASVTAAALNTFGLEAGQAEYVANLLAAAANSSSANISDLAMGLQQGGFAFNAANQDVDDLAASLAILTNVGLTGSDSGTALKNAFMRMISPTKEARGVMDELGISFFDAQGNMRPLSDIIANLNEATAGLTEEQRLAALETMFLSDGMKAMIPLLATGESGFLAMKDAVNEAGAAQAVADARMRGLSGAVEYASGSLESAMLKVWQPFEGTISALIRRGADLITWLSDLPRPIINAALAFTAVLAAAGPLLLAIPAIGAFIAALLSPIGAVVVAAALLASAWASNFGDIQGKTQAVFDAVQPLLSRLSEYLDMIKAGDWSGLAKAVFGDVSSLLQKATATIEAFSWSDWIDGVLAWADYIGAITWDAFISALTWTSDIVSSVDWATFISALTDWSTAVGTVAWDAFIGALTWTADIIGKVNWPDFIEALGAWTNYIEALAWSSFVSALTWGADYIQSLDWAGFVATLTDWGTWISSLDWTKIITTYIDWALWIPALVWNTFVTAMDWSTYILGFLWTEYISKLSWSDFVASLSWGSKQVGKLKWSDFVAALDWVGYIAEFAWESFVSKVEWPVIAEFVWNEWIVDFEWPTLPSFDWNSWISSFSWPSVTWPGWNDWIPSFRWPSIPAFNWEDWINPFNWGGGGDAPGKASGTMHWRGGPVTLNERGTELIALPGRYRQTWLPRGSKIIPAEQVPLMAGGGGTTVNLYATVTGEADEERLAWRVANIIRRNS